MYCYVDTYLLIYPQLLQCSQQIVIMSHAQVEYKNFANELC